MKLVWIFLGFLAVFGAVGHADDSKYYDDYWYDDEVDKLGIKHYPDDIPVPNNEEEDVSKKVEELNKQLELEVSDLNQNEDNEQANENIDDYQIEDNRSELKEKEDDVSVEYEYPLEDMDLEHSSWEADEKPKSLEVIDENSDEIEEEKLLKDFNYFDDTKDGENEQYIEKDDLELDESRNDDKEIRPLQGSLSFDVKQKDNEDLLEEKAEVFDDIDETQRKIVKETDELLKEYQENDFVDEKSDNSKVKKDEDIKKVVDETKYLLEEGEESNLDFDEGFADKNIFDEGNNGSENDMVKLVDQNENKSSYIDHIMEETQKILNETGETFDEKENIEDKKNSNKDSDENLENEFNISENDDEHEDEDTVDMAYQDLKDDLEKLHETWNKLRNEINDKKENEEDFLSLEDINSRLSEIENSALEDDYEEIDDDNIFKIFEDQPDDINDEDEQDENPSSNEKEKEDQQVVASNVKHDNQQLSKESVENVSEKLIQYVDDALVANEVPVKGEDSVEFSTTTTHTVKVHNVEPLEVESNDEMTSSEFKNLINDVLGAPDQEPKAETDVKATTEQKRITLSVDEPVSVTSSNYPRPYPTNAVTEWILEGDGMGIEFNVTDFAVNGNNGDHVLIKPGRVDGSGSDGLIFSYMLRKERYYRFLDVNRMFIRFEANPGMQWQRGFNFSVKLIYPLRERIAEEPEPEIPDIGYPESTLTINLGGVTLERFLTVKEDFRQIVADMATMYIHANGIDLGRNTTLEVTQITSTALCFNNWPKFEQCTEVRFGVPLQYADEDAEPRLNEEDLRDMWWTYSQQDPFALRLRRLNITEFQIPDDSNILMVWLVIAAGVVISMAMLAFALWRFSCFEDYSRMPAFSDTESINEKKTLDLYPTPHQTLPSLYAETDYKWGEDKFAEAARADMGGFANRSYVRNDDYDFDSDEEVVVARDRNARIRPRDIYNV